MKTEDQLRRSRLAQKRYRERWPDRVIAQKERYLGRPIPHRGSMEDRFWAKVEKSDACWLWTGARDDHGYGCLVIARRAIKAHRVSWQIHNGPIPDGLWVLHHCDNPPCIRPDHLFVGTRQDNVDDAAAKGRMYVQKDRERAIRQLHLGQDNRGEANPRARLTAAIVREIRASSAPVAELALIYAVSRYAIYDVRARRSWAHVA